jgi:hypothetical protein
MRLKYYLSYIEIDFYESNYFIRRWRQQQLVTAHFAAGGDSSAP